MTRIAFLTAIFTVSAYVHIPYFIPFTLQTFVLMLSLCVFGSPITLEMLCVYTMFGCAGFPVFSSFRGGFSAILEPNGGYIVGFFLAALFFGLLNKVARRFSHGNVVLSLLPLIPIYAAATTWYALLYLSEGIKGFASAFSVCVLPYIIPDILKATAAGIVADKIKKHI